MKVKQNIERYLVRPLPDSEAENICAYLAGSRLEGDVKVAYLTPPSEEARRLVHYYLDAFAKHTGKPLHEGLIAPALLSHVRPLLKRLAENLTVKNPLLEDVKQEYGAIFHLIRKISDEAMQTFSLPPINDDEVGFLSLYFARYVEKYPSPTKVLVICTTGIGTSELLKTKVCRFFPEIEVVGTASSRTVTAERIIDEGISLILSTVPIQTVPVPVVLVNTLFIAQDQKNVREALRAIREGEWK